MSKKQIVIYSTFILLLIILVGGISYSYFVYNKDVGSINMSTGDISLNYSSVTNNVSSSSAIPMSDYDGKNQSNYLDFTVTGTVDIYSILYELDIIPDNENTLNAAYIKLYLTDQSDNPIIEPFLYTELYNAMSGTGKGFYQEVIEANSSGTTNNYSKSFRLRVWIDDSYSNVSAGTFDFDINVYSINEDIDDLTKVTFHMDNGRLMEKYYNKNEEIVNAPNPVRANYVLSGWTNITSDLPSTYTRYEYVETDGSQYFDSGYTPNSDTNIKVDFMTPSEIPTNASKVLFFSGSSAVTYGFALCSSATSGKLRAFYKTAWNGDFLNTNTRYTVYFNKEKLYLNDSLIHTFNVNTFTSPYTLPFFAQYYQNTTPINYAPNGTRIYGIEIYQDFDLVHYFVPVLNTSTNKVGFYDRVSGNFYNSQGSGDFTGAVYSENNSQSDEEQVLYAKWNQI